MKSKALDRRAIDLPPNSVTSPIEVDNPYRVGPDAPDKIVVMQNRRGDPLAWMWHRGMPDALYLAGRRWQMLHDRSEIGGIQAMDYGKPKVSGGGGFREPITDGHRKAVESLKLADEIILKSTKDRNKGRERVRIVRDVLGKSMFPLQVAEAMGMFGDNNVRKITREFRRALDAMSRSFEWQNVKI